MSLEPRRPAPTFEESVVKHSGHVIRKRVQALVLAAVRSRGAYGMTNLEVMAELELTQGSAASALSKLHEKGHLARLSLKRKGYKVYVTVDRVGGRPTEDRQSRSPGR